MMSSKSGISNIFLENLAPLITINISSHVYKKPYIGTKYTILMSILIMITMRVLYN